MVVALGRSARAVAVFVVIAAGCSASATVERTMPVASLQAFRTVALRVRNSTFASQGQTIALEQQVLQKLRKTCGFEQVDRASGQPADVIIDLNITKTARGGGFLSNTNVATVETLLVLTDSQDGQLLGTATIRGKSGGIVVNNASPENEAIEAIANSVADLLAKSGCSGPRIARAAEPPPRIDDGAGSGSGSGSATTPPPDDNRLAQAEALNDQGREKLYAADLQGALSAFQRANQLAPDARFAFNACIVLNQLEQWDNAIAACTHAKSLDPAPALAAKIDNRLAQLRERK